jgi:hypothetical protein
MIKYIKRTTDNKFLKSVETEAWVDDIKEALEMTYAECEAVKTALSGVFLPGQLKEIIDMRKSKPISEEEKQQILTLLRVNSINP